MLNWKVIKITRETEGIRDEISELWARDVVASPFVSPHYIEMMIRHVLGKGDRVFLAKGYSRNGVLSALWPVRMDRAGTFSILQDFLCDYATAMYDTSVDAQALAVGMAELLRCARPKSILLKPLPAWGHTLDAAVAGIKQAGYRCWAFPFAKAPALISGLDKKGRAEFNKKLCRSRSLRNYTNRIKREKGFNFEVNTGEAGIDQWADQFCDAHIRRWASTSTPSKYRHKAARQALKAALRAWVKDGRLIRFSLIAMYRRITYVIALKFGRTLIYFHTARLPVYNKLSTGNITIHLMGLWMQENGFNNIDFGMGDEGYKYFFANHSRTIWKIRGARSICSPSAFLGAAESYLRKKVCLMRLWTAVKSRFKRVARIYRG